MSELMAQQEQEPGPYQEPLEIAEQLDDAELRCALEAMLLIVDAPVTTEHRHNSCTRARRVARTDVRADQEPRRPIRGAPRV